MKNSCFIMKATAIYLRNRKSFSFSQRIEDFLRSRVRVIAKKTEGKKKTIWGKFNCENVNAKAKAEEKKIKTNKRILKPRSLDQPPTTLNPWQLRIDLDRIYLKILVRASCLCTSFLLLSFALSYSFGKFIFPFSSRFVEKSKELKSK